MLLESDNTLWQISGKQRFTRSPPAHPYLSTLHRRYPAAHWHRSQL